MPFALPGLAVAFTAIFFAIADLTSPRDLGRLAIALAWFLAGVNGLFASYALVKREPWWAGPTLANGLSAIAIAGFILWADSRSPEPESWMPGIWILFFAGIATVVVTAWQHRITPVITWKVLLTSVLPVFVVVQFWFTNVYAHLHHTPQVNLSTSLQELGRSQTTIQLRGTITIENNSGGRVQVMGSIYRVEGKKRDAATDVSPPDDSQLATAVDWVDPNMHRFDAPLHSTPPPRLLQADEILGQDWFLDPGEKWSTDVAILADAGVYDRVQLTAELEVGRAANLDLGDRVSACVPHWDLGRPIGGDSPEDLKFLCDYRTVRPINEVERRVGDSPVVAEILLLSGPARDGPYPEFFVERVSRGALLSDADWDQQDRQLRDRYPVADTSSSTELPVS